MHKKGKADAARGKIFTKLAREITIAAKLGMPSIDANPRLRLAVIAARKENMPKDNIERAIKKGAEKTADSNFEEVRYEGFAPHGVSIIVECLTDNKNRTLPEVRSLINKNGGTFGEAGSVSFNFSRVGEITYAKNNISFDDFMEAAIVAGAEDVEEDGPNYIAYSEVADLHKVAKSLEDRFGEPEEAILSFRALTTVPLDNLETAQSVINFIEKLEDNDDVQNVFSNFELSDDVAKKLSED